MLLRPLNTLKWLVLVAPGWIVYDLTDNGVAAVIAGVVGFFGALLLIGALMDWRER